LSGSPDGYTRADNRENICRFFDDSSRGYQFLDKSVILSKQAKELFLGRQATFKRLDAIAKPGLTFRSLLSSTSVKTLLNREYGDVTRGWAKMTRAEIEKTVEREEAETYVRLVERLILKLISRQIPDASEFMAIPNALFTELSEVAAEAGHLEPQFAAIEFLRSRILEVPGIRIESAMLAKEAALYARDNPRQRSAEDPFANHARDIDMAATYIPYCDVALIENGRADSIRQCKNLFPRLPLIFTSRTVDDFFNWISELPGPAYAPPHIAEWLMNVEELEPQRLAIAVHPSHPDFFVDSGSDFCRKGKFVAQELGGGGIFIAMNLASMEVSAIEKALREILEVADRTWITRRGKPVVEAVIFRKNAVCESISAEMPFGFIELLTPPLSVLAATLLTNAS